MKHPVWPRRDFLKAAGLAVSTLALGDGPADAAPITLHEVVAIDL
jgi:hypothetical protein